MIRNATMTLLQDGRERVVLRRHYVTAKTKQLRAFGYSDLTEKHVQSQLESIFAGAQLDVIGLFMSDEVKTT